MSGRTYTQEEVAAAWESGYWHGTSHTGPLNEAAVAAKNPYRKKNGGAGAGTPNAATTEPTNT